MQNATSAIQKLLTQGLGSPSSCMLEDKAKKNDTSSYIRPSKPTVQVWRSDFVHVWLRFFRFILETSGKNVDLRWGSKLDCSNTKGALNFIHLQINGIYPLSRLLSHDKCVWILNGEIQVVGICCLVSWSSSTKVQHSTASAFWEKKIQRAESLRHFSELWRWRFRI